jgi:hypothetical protein
MLVLGKIAKQERRNEKRWEVSKKGNNRTKKEA